jgi:tetratricopeptide (TPR) repeat protein
MVLSGLCACAMLAPVNAAAARLTAQEIGAHLTEGEQAFRKAIELDRSSPDSARVYYEEAILNFEAIRKDGGIKNGKLFYDIGNAYFRLGDVGRAILNYKRAELFMPNDPNLEQNLDYARNRRADRIDVRQKEKVLKTLLFIHYDVPPRVKLAVLAIVFAALWVAASVRLCLAAAWLKAVIIVSAVAGGIFLVSLVADSAALTRNPEGVITADEVVGRMGDAETYQPSFKEPLHSGSEFRLLEKRPGWWRIELENGDRTWVPEGSAELVY